METDPSQHDIDGAEYTAQERSLAEWLDPDSRRLEGLDSAVPVTDTLEKNSTSVKSAGKLALKDPDEPEKGWIVAS